MAIAGRRLMVVLAACFAMRSVTCLGTSMMMGRSRHGANPIRRVVNMLKAMQTKVTEEGEKETALFEKYMCYCKTSSGGLGDSLAASKTKIPELRSEIEESSSQRAQLKEDLAQHKSDRKEAKASLAEATALREKEATAFAGAHAEHTSNIAAVGKAVAALEKGMGGVFLQTKTAELLKHLLQGRATASLESEQQEAVLAFLDGSSKAGYAPASGEITGILKQIGDTMSKDLADEISTEDDAKKTFAGLTVAKQREIGALTTAVEEKSVRQGDLSVGIATKKNALADTEEAAAADEQFLADLKRNCETKSAEWDAIVKTRSQEQIAIAETIKLLDDDDALELFKKALPSPAHTSLLQIDESAGSVKSRALATLRQGMAGKVSPQMDFIALALQGRKGGFDKVLDMIDGMVKTLKQEQTDDDTKKQYCQDELDKSDDEKKNSERKVSDSEKAIASAKEELGALATEITNLGNSITDLDKMVAQATEQRKEEHAAFNELVAMNTAAKDLIGIAKNRLLKFYNPKLYVAPTQKELTRAGRISTNFGVEQVAPATDNSAYALSQEQDAPPPAPESPSYSKKTQESGGVTEMMNLLVNDLDKETTEAETEEKDSQADYEKAMTDSTAKRAEDAKVLADKERARAEMEATLQTHKDSKISATKELDGTVKYIALLHNDCDWLVQNFGARKEARAAEVESLVNAKAVLNGADYSFLQTMSVKLH